MKIVTKERILTLSMLFGAAVAILFGSFPFSPRNASKCPTSFSVCTF